MAVANALHRAGWDVWTPLFAAHSRIDLLAVGTAGVQRIQCKSASIRPGGVFFRTCSNTGNHPVDHRGQVDAFGVYSPSLDAVYLVPIDDVPRRGALLRLEPTRNGQMAGVRWAADYLVEGPDRSRNVQGGAGVGAPTG